MSSKNTVSVDTPAVSFTKPVSAELVGDIICTVVESGAVSDWACTTRPVFTGLRPEPKTASIYMAVTVIEDETGREFYLDAAAIAAGITAMMGSKFKINEAIRGYALTAVIEDDAGHIDIEVADCIVQAAMFGKLVYG